MNAIDVRQLISENRLSVRLEPVVSLRQKALIGHEARLAPTEGLPSGAALRAEAGRQNLSVDYDRWFRRAGLAVLPKTPEERGLVFMAFDTAVLDLGVGGSGHLSNLVAERGLSPSDVVIAIRESKVDDLEALKAFVAHHRAQGFLIALKGLGEGHSNLERLTLVRPDILKIGEGLTAGIEKDFFHQEIVRSLVALSRKIGALVVAEGITEESQALATLDLGVDMLQGVFWTAEGGWNSRLDRLAEKHKTFAVEKAKAAGLRVRGFETLLGQLVKSLSGQPIEAAENTLAQFVGAQASIECAFVLDAEGQQVTETVARPDTAFKKSPLFRPARKGADHSLKDYFYLLGDTFVTRYRSEPYVSLATGHLCVTLTALFRDARNSPHVVCLDVPWA